MKQTVGPLFANFGQISLKSLSPQIMPTPYHIYHSITSQGPIIRGIPGILTNISFVGLTNASRVSNRMSPLIFLPAHPAVMHLDADPPDSSKEVWKLNLRQYEQMEKHRQEETRTWRKSEGRR